MARNGDDIGGEIQGATDTNHRWWRMAFRLGSLVPTANEFQSRNLSVLYWRRVF